MGFPRGHLSYSQIRTYLICPKKYEFGYISGIRVPQSDKLLLGVVFHAALEWYFRSKLAHRDPSVNELEEWFNGEFDRVSREQDVRWDVPRGRVRDRGIAFTRYFHSELAHEFSPLLVEQELEAPIPGHELPLRGVLDLVEEDLRITDFKTATTRWSKSRVRHSRLQMVIYKYLFEHSYGDANSNLRFCVIYSRKGDGVRSQLLEVPAGPDDREHLFGVIEHVGSGISAGRFPRNEGFRCAFCEYRDHCLDPNLQRRKNGEKTVSIS